MELFQNYLMGREIEVWEQIQNLAESIQEPKYIQEWELVAREFMKRVRGNLEILITRWEKKGHIFGYNWAAGYNHEDISQAPELLGSPTNDDIMALEQFESRRGRLPITLRAFYEVVGAVNFGGTVADGWPDRETLDPLQIYSFTSQLPALLEEEDEVLICPDELHKYFISGIGGITMRVPDPCFDGVLLFEGDPLQFDDKPLTLCLYLREVILKRGGIGLIAGLNEDPPEPDLLEFLTKDLKPF